MGDWNHKDSSLFTPSIDAMADAAVEVDREGCLTLVVSNSSDVALQLGKGDALGKLEPVDFVKPKQLKIENEDRAAKCAAVLALPQDEERKVKLLEQLNLQVDHLSGDQKLQVEELLTKYSDVFALDTCELETTKLVTHSINTGDHPPIRQPVRRMPFALHEKVKEMVNEMISQDVIRPSKSPWASPIVLVQKKDGGIRFCIDYRRLNHITKLDVFPLPRIDDTFDQLSGSKFFTTLDLASGYWQVRMDSVSQEKTAFVTYSGLYEFKKMPFGLVNAPHLPRSNG